MNAILKPKESGAYIFAIIGDDGTQLTLNGEIVAKKYGWGGYQNWSNAGVSKSIILNAGEIYPIEAILKESGGAEHISVGWRKVDDENFSIVPANQLFMERLTSDNVKPIFASHATSYTIKSANGRGDTVLSTVANDSQGDNLTYTIVGDVPFAVDANGQITISGSLEIKTYSFDVQVSDGTHTVTTHLEITSTSNTVGLNEAKDNFYTKAKAFTKESNVDELVNSYLAYAHIKAQNTYDEFMTEDADTEIWDYINNNLTIKEGLYASRFPANPYAVKNLARFKAKWEEDGKDADFINRYKNVALGLAINAREAGIEKELQGGDTSEHPTIDYRKLPHYEAQEQRWREHFDFKYLGNGIGYRSFKNYMKIKYNLSGTERDALWGSRSSFKRIEADGKSISDLSPEERTNYGVSFDALNLYRVSHGLSRANCYDDGNPCQKIEAYIANENNTTLTKNYILAHFKEYKSLVGLVNANNGSAWSLRGELGVIPKEKNDYRLMSFYDLANWKITNDQIPAKDFGDKAPNWPIFHSQL
jgi:hypothetical protein